MRTIVLLILALVLAPAGCTQRSGAQGTMPAPAGDTGAAETAPAGIPKAVIIAGVVALVIVGIALASADSDPFLDYSDICGSPDCS